MCRGFDLTKASLFRQFSPTSPLHAHPDVAGLQFDANRVRRRKTSKGRLHSAEAFVSTLENCRPRFMKRGPDGKT